MVQRRLASETDDCWVGPCPISEFLDLIGVALPTTLPPPDLRAFKTIPMDDGKEEDMYLPLIVALYSLKLENLGFRDTSGGADQNAPYYKPWKPNISTYTLNSEQESDGTVPLGTNTAEFLLPFKLKRGKNDPFNDNLSGEGAKFENPSKIATRIRGQIMAMLSEAFSYSFRTHAFSVFVDGSIARIFRADRAGVIVSEAFDYRTTPHLIEFLRRFNSAEPWQRGIDDTAISLRAVQIPISILSSGPIEVTMLGAGLPRTESLVSRGRRVVVVYDKNSLQKYFMKDGWRVDEPGITTECDILSELIAENVPHIPTFTFGGDFLNSVNWGLDPHRTISNQYALKAWAGGRNLKLTPRVHYRFIEEDVGKPLAGFGNAKELAQVLADVIETLKAAMDKCGYLHRDVSSGNIMISPEGRGFLVDWEFAKKIPRGVVEPARAPGRTGTWAYISCPLLILPEKQHSCLDDLQSVYWVALEKALSYLKHQSPCLADVARCFTEYHPTDDSGGSAKFNHLNFRPKITFQENHAFSELLHKFRRMMYFATMWELLYTTGQDPAERGIKGSDVPNHAMVLDLFYEALSHPTDEHNWSEERETTKRFLDFIEHSTSDTPLSTSEECSLSMAGS